DVAKEVSKDSDADVESELLQADPYGDWSTFTGQIVSGVSFEYPSTMTVSEVNEGGGFVEINIMEKNQSNPRLILSNTPWGCVGPYDDTRTIPLAYDVLLGQEPVTITQACGDFLALGVSAIGLQ